MWLDLPDDEAPDDSPSEDERVLVAIMARPADWERVQREGWYRIPIARAPKRIAAEYLAFYHTAAFAQLRWSIAYYAPIQRLRLLRRCELLPEEAAHPRADALYYKFELGPLILLPQPIPSLKLRRISFIMTTLARLRQATEINDLWDREVARDRLWRALKAEGIVAQRGYAVEEEHTSYHVDLAVFCARAALAIKCLSVDDPRGEPDNSPAGADLRPFAGRWAVRRFSVREVMAETGVCVSAVQQFIEENGPALRHVG